MNTDDAKALKSDKYSSNRNKRRFVIGIILILISIIVWTLTLFSYFSDQKWHVDAYKTTFPELRNYDISENVIRYEKNESLINIGFNLFVMFPLFLLGFRYLTQAKLFPWDWQANRVKRYTWVVSYFLFYFGISCLFRVVSEVLNPHPLSSMLRLKVSPLDIFLFAIISLSIFLWLYIGWKKYEKSIKTCPNCKEPYEHNTKFCVACGTKMSLFTEEIVFKQQSETGKAKMPRSVIVSIIFYGLTLLFVHIYLKNYFSLGYWPDIKSSLITSVLSIYIDENVLHKLLFNMDKNRWLEILVFLPFVIFIVPPLHGLFYRKSWARTWTVVYSLSIIVLPHILREKLAIPQNVLTLTTLIIIDCVLLWVTISLFGKKSIDWFKKK